jgi:hypothetical protein
MSFLYYICHQMWWQSVYALFFNKLSFFGDKCTPFCHHFVLRISNWNYRFLCFCAPNVTKRVDNCTQHKWSEQNQLVTNVLRYFRVIEKYWGFLSLPKMQSWRTHFVYLSDRVYSWNNFVHFTNKHDLKSQTFGYGCYGVIFGWVKKTLIRAVNRAKSVTNFQSGSKRCWVVRLLKMSLKGLWRLLRGVLAC